MADSWHSTLLLFAISNLIAYDAVHATLICCAGIHSFVAAT